MSAVNIWLSACPINCAILLSDRFIEVKIKIKRIKLFYDEITSDRIENTFQITVGMISTQLRVCKLCPR